MLSVKNLSIAYEEHTVLHRVNFHLKPGQILGIAGPNGAGKSTLVRAILGLEAPAEGQVILNGYTSKNWRQFRKAAAKIAYVPQKQAVAVHFPITVRQIVEMGLMGQFSWFGQKNERHKQLIQEAMDVLNLHHVADRKFSDLSGGQQQKALVGRTIAQGAELMILDEPFRGVDANSQKAIVQVLERHRATGGSVILVHHGIDQLAEISDNLAIVNRRIMALGEPSSLLKRHDVIAILRGDDKDKKNHHHSFGYNRLYSPANQNELSDIAHMTAIQTMPKHTEPEIQNVWGKLRIKS